MKVIIAKYRLKKDLPDLPKGVIFEHREFDNKHPDRGNRGCGCLILAWGEKGDCQASWCGDTYIFPGQLARNREWFEPVEAGVNTLLLEGLQEVQEQLNKLRQKIEQNNPR